MSADLTRWNRAGLKRLQYVDGNAAVYYERLRGAQPLVVHRRVRVDVLQPPQAGAVPAREVARAHPARPPCRLSLE